MRKRDVIHELRRALDLTYPFFTMDPPLLLRSYAPGKWTARQILAHLTDCEAAFQARIRHILAQPGCDVPAIDQDRWARTLVYTERDLRLARRLFTSCRESLIELLDLLPEAIFGREGRHPGMASCRAWDVATRTSTHNMHHYGQLVAIRDGNPWEP